MIYLGSDHRGFELKNVIKKYLEKLGHDVQDLGPFEYDKDDDYPDFISKVAQKVSEDPENDKGIVLGMSGQGEAMVANKFKGVRAAVFYGPPYQFKAMGWRKWMLIGSGAAGVFQVDEFKTLQKLVKLSREHNDANVLSLGAGFLNEGAAKKIVKLWLETPFGGEERHVRRIGKIKALENV